MTPRPHNRSARLLRAHFPDLTFRLSGSVYLVKADRKEMIMATTSEAPVTAGAATHTTIRSSLGDLTLVTRDGAVAGLYFPHHWHMPDLASFGEYRDAGLDEVRRQLGEYLAGERREFDVPVETAGSPLQERVWRLIGQIPYGATASYGEVSPGNSAAGSRPRRSAPRWAATR